MNEKMQFHFPFLFKYYQNLKQKSCKNCYLREYRESGCYGLCEKNEQEEVVCQKEALTSDDEK